MSEMMDNLISFGLEMWNWLPADLQILLLILGKIVLILIPLMLCVAYITYAERKIIGYMQIRIGPQPCGFPWLAATHCRCHEAAVQGSYHSQQV